MHPGPPPWNFRSTSRFSLVAQFPFHQEKLVGREKNIRAHVSIVAADSDIENDVDLNRIFRPWALPLVPGEQVQVANAFTGELQAATILAYEHKTTEVQLLSVKYEPARHQCRFDRITAVVRSLAFVHNDTCLCIGRERGQDKGAVSVIRTRSAELLYTINFDHHVTCLSSFFISPTKAEWVAVANGSTVQMFKVGGSLRH